MTKYQKVEKINHSSFYHSPSATVDIFRSISVLPSLYILENIIYAIWFLKKFYHYV